MISKNQLLLLLSFSFLFISCQPDESQKPEDDHIIRAMTYNIRFDIPDDNNDEWDNRKAHLTNMVQFYEPAFLGIQEGLLHQLQYLEEKLETYKWIGVGRDDGGTEGEFSAIFYDTTKVKLQPETEETIWLSETPEKPSKGWDADFPRVLTSGEFQHISSGQTIAVFNTHFDHVGETARLNSAKLIKNKLADMAAGTPVILMGDFNFSPNSDPYEILTTGENGLRDSYKNTETAPVGPSFTYEGFEVGSENDGRRIDYIFVNEGVQIDHHATISSFRDGQYPSDHLPVAVDVRLE